VLFFNGLFESLRRGIVLQPPSCFGCLQYASSTASHPVLPPRDSILSPKAQSASPNVLCCRASTSSPLLLRASLACSLFRFLRLSLSLSFSVLLTSSSLCGRSLKGTSLFFRVLFVFRRTKLFPPSSLLSNPNRLVTVYHW